jgi:ATPase subunit of ABC transporter with duplicated ATPase domains
LLAPYDALLLDEPTNDLDFAGLDLLGRFLARSEAGIVVVSHDRAFLERTVERVLELEEGTRAAREYAGGFAEYERLRRLERRRQSAAYGDYDERRRELEDPLRQRQGQAAGARGSHPSTYAKYRTPFSSPEATVRTTCAWSRLAASCD